MTATRDLLPPTAVERFLDSLRTDLASQTIRDYGYRLGQFADWCERHDEIEHVSDLDGYLLDGYVNHRRRKVAAVTLSNELQTLRQFIRYCERIEAATDGLHEKIVPPGVDESDEVSDTKLAPADAEAALAAWRDSADRACRHHVTLELLWYTSARMGAIRALDLDDFQRDPEHGDATLAFRHLPKQETPLKNQQKGERVVGIPPEPAAVVEEWITTNRPRVVDDYGREPLLATVSGRVSLSTIRHWCYFATVPCRYRECPHGKVPADCDWYSQSHASGCPSSVSPHPVRSGSMEWQRDRQVPIEVVSDRANASPEVIEKHYDNPDPHRAQQQRRRPYLDQLDFGEDGDGATDANGDSES